MSTLADRYETLLYTERDGIAFVTLNRPDALNAFDSTMMREVQDLWRSLRTNDDVRCVVLTGSGSRAFCVGIDRNADDTYVVFEKRTLYGTSNNYMYDDPDASSARSRTTSGSRLCAPSTAWRAAARST